MGDGAGTEVKETTKETPPQGQPPPPDAKAAPPSGEKVPDRVPPTARLLSDEDDDDKIESGTKYELSGKDFKRRLDRQRAKLLRELGSEDGDVEKIRAKLKRHDELEAKFEEERRAKLAEDEKLKEDRDRALARAEKAEARAQAIAEEKEIDKAVSGVAKIAAEILDEDYVDDVIHGAFKKHLRTLDEDEIDALKTADIRAWFKEYAERKPKLAKGYEPPPARKEGITNGNKPNEKPEERRSTEHEVNGKTIKPGRQNTMSRQEYEAEKRRLLNGR